MFERTRSEAATETESKCLQESYVPRQSASAESAVWNGSNGLAQTENAPESGTAREKSWRQQLKAE
jgi:hypothetical protein